jgi:mono/diheme cytochrome c family protein
MMTRTFAMILGFGLLAGPAFGADVKSGMDYAVHHCAKCHGTDGKGNGPALAVIGVTTPPVDWTDKAAMSKLTDDYLTEIIQKGGKAVGKSTHMPAYADKLSGTQVADLVAYIRSLSK